MDAHISSPADKVRAVPRHMYSKGIEAPSRSPGRPLMATGVRNLTSPRIEM